MRVLVCGGRNYGKTVGERQKLYYELHGLPKPLTVICGGAPGADTLAEGWARANALPVIVFPAEWDVYGKAAGPIRNRKMLAEGKPNLVVAFPGGRGTADMVAQARAAGVRIKVLE